MTGAAGANEQDSIGYMLSTAGFVIQGVPVADDGTVQFRNEERVEFSHIVRSKHIGRWPHILICACFVRLMVCVRESQHE